jgi:EmrB/QacA subfamily drug resistance transporter
MDAAAERKREGGEVNPARVLALCSGVTFLAFLDFAIVNIAFPPILDEFPDTSINTMTWIVSGYAVMFAALLAPAGRIADSVGRRNVFLWSVGAFTVASLVCGVAPSVEWLIAGRFVQGAAAGGMVPAALGLILATTPPERIPRAVALWSTAAGFAAAIGPAVGGLLLEAFGWRAVFLVNLPFGVALVMGGVAVLPAHVRGSGDRRPDAIGTVALGLGVVGVVSALTEGENWGWGSAATIGVGVVGLALVGASVLRSRTHPAPAIDVEVWRSPTYKIATRALGLISITMFAWNLAAPLFAATIWDWTILETAGALSVGAVSFMVASLSVGRLTDPGVRVKVAILGCLLFAGSNAIWASDLFGATPNFLGAWLPAAILGGGGLGLAMTCLSTMVAGALAPLKFAGGMGMTLAVRQVGGAIGVAGFAAIIASSAEPGGIASFHNVFYALIVVNVACALAVGALLPVFRRPSTPTLASAEPR